MPIWASWFLYKEFLYLNGCELKFHIFKQKPQKTTRKTKILFLPRSIAYPLDELKYIEDFIERVTLLYVHISFVILFIIDSIHYTWTSCIIYVKATSSIVLSFLILPLIARNPTRHLAIWHNIAIWRAARHVTRKI